MGTKSQFKGMDISRDLLLEKFASASDELLKLKIITTDSFTGEIGEFIACQIFKLTKSKRVNKAVDGICPKGKKYQIKSKIGSNYSFTTSRIDSSLFDFLVIIYFDDLYNPLKAIRIPSKKIKSNIVRITSSNISDYEDISLSDFALPIKQQKAITSFANIYNLLLEYGIIRSRRIVGDIGEFYACDRLKLTISDSKNEKGFDARHSNGLTFEIKTRRVYDSERRISETRRLNNLEGKSADYLIVVTLDRLFQCSGMWVIPMGNIKNKKSANLMIVNNTPGTLNLVPSRINYLKTGYGISSIEELSRNRLPYKEKRKPSENKKNGALKFDNLQITETRERRNITIPKTQTENKTLRDEFASSFIRQYNSGGCFFIMVIIIIVLLYMIGELTR